MNARSFHTLLIVIMISTPIVGAFTKVESTAAQNSSIDITKVARVGENFLEWDIANNGESNVWVAPYAQVYMQTAIAPYYEKIMPKIDPVFINDAYHWSLCCAGSANGYSGRWVNVPAYGVTRVYSQGELPPCAKWVVYNALVYHNGNTSTLYPVDKYTNVDIGYNDARRPTLIWYNSWHSYPHVVFYEPEKDYGWIVQGQSQHLMFAVEALPYNQSEWMLQGKWANFYIDNQPAPSTSGSCNYTLGYSDPHAVSDSVFLTLSPQDTSNLSPGMHLLTVNFSGDSIYGPSTYKVIFRVIGNQAN